MAFRLLSLYSKFISSGQFSNKIFIKQSVQKVLKSFRSRMGNSFSFPFDLWKLECQYYSRKSFEYILNRNYKSMLLMASIANMLPRQNKDKTRWNNEREMVNNISLAEMALRNGDNDQARLILMNALITATEKDVKVGISCVYDMLATLAFKNGEIINAEKLLIEAIERLIADGMPEDDNQVVNFSMKLSRLYCNLKQDKLAELGFKNCIMLQKQKIKNGIKDEETGMLWISILFWYGKFLLSRNRYDEAKTYLEWAYAASAQVKSVLLTQIMVILYHLSEISIAKQDYDDALKHLLNAVILGKETDNSDLPLYYVKIGAAYLHKGIYNQAKVWCEKGKNVSKALRNKETEGQAEGCLQKLKALSFS